jgi:hypothetical protein
MPEKYIPEGMYCYNSRGLCPFWDKKPGQYPTQEDGYCHFLGKSDWELNEESQGSVVLVHYPADRSLEGKSVEEIYHYNDHIDPVSGKHLHFGTSLIWDQCKECGINMDDPEDVEYQILDVDESSTFIENLLKGK